MNRKQQSMIVLSCLLTMLYGCMSAARHAEDLSSSKEREMTVGIVQKEIRVGMSQADVATALGSPNIVTKDSDDKEAWIYDKIATEASFSTSGAGVAAGSLAADGKTLILGLLGGGVSAGATSTTQKTLTVIIRFGKNNLVESFSYHASKF